MLNVSPGFDPKSTRQPVFNLPVSVSALVLLLAGIHVLRMFALGDDANVQVILRLAFIPIRITDPGTVQEFLPIGAERIWTFATYGLLHADWSHLIFNCLWLAAFGSPLAWRFGTVRFLVFATAGAAAGAAIHLLVHPASPAPLVGASAAISACMAAAARFVFASGGPVWRRADPAAYRQPAQPLGQVIGNRQVLTFLGIWFGINLLIGLTAGNGGFASGAIAWEAHIGGFLLGLFLFPVFDPVRPAAT